MINRFIAILTLILLSSFINKLHSQDLALKDLFLLQSKNFEYVNDFLLKKGWELHEAKVQDEALFYDYQKSVSWSLNKNSWSEKAEGWFYLFIYDGYDNAVRLQTTMSNFNSLKNQAKARFKLVDSKVGDNEVETIYEMGPVRIVFTIQKEKEDEYDYDLATYYLVEIYNYKDVKEKLEKILAIQLLEEQYNSYISSADSSLDLKNYDLAKYYYQEAIKISPDRDYPHNKIADIVIIEEKIALDKKYNDFIDQADLELSKKNYTSALSYYQSASKVYPEKTYPKDKIKEINKIQDFLTERKVKIYDYEEIDNSGYKKFEQDLTYLIKNEFKDKDIDFNLIADFTFSVDTLAKSKFSSKIISSSDEKLSNNVVAIAKNKSLQPVSKYGYRINVSSTIRINISMENNIVSVKKNNVETRIDGDKQQYSNDVNRLISSKPIGKYKLSIQKKEVNGSDFSNNKIVNYKIIGGPSNAFLSLLVPGLGVKNVTGGSENGYKRTLWAYGLIASGFGCKYLSNMEYDLYHDATDQTSMDEHYENANFYHHSYYVLVGAGALVWLYDVVWVANKGFQNRKNTRSFRQQFSLNYNHYNNGLCFNYSIKF